MIDVRYVIPFIASTKDVFGMMLATDVTVHEPRVADAEYTKADVSAVIGLSGDAVGCLALCFPMTSAIRTASRFAGVRMSLDHEDFCDALGELASIVAGHAKAKFEGLECSISLPNVIIGKEHVVTYLSGTPRVALRCDSALGGFCVQIGLVVTKPCSEDALIIGGENLDTP